jgi:hypothetical protein
LGPNVAYCNGIELKIKNTKKTANPPIYEISEPLGIVVVKDPGATVGKQ